MHSHTYTDDMQACKSGCTLCGIRMVLTFLGKLNISNPIFVTNQTLDSYELQNHIQNCNYNSITLYSALTHTLLSCLTNRCTLESSPPQANIGSPETPGKVKKSKPRTNPRPNDIVCKAVNLPINRKVISISVINVSVY